MEQQQLDDVLAQCFASIKRNSQRFAQGRPIIGEELRYKRNVGDEIQPDNWVEGFWPGQLWLAYEETGDEALLEAARAYHPYFIKRFEQPDRFSHDVGFLYTLTMVADYKATGHEAAKHHALEAAKVLAARFNVKGQFIRAWNAWADISNEGRIIIDTMENLPLLFWASEVTGDSQFAEIASAHAYTSARHLVRDDGSSFHCFDFDPETGAPLSGATHQGYSDDSCWSRGQAWGIHGFARAYAYTQDDVFLNTSKKLAHYALDFLKEDAVPIWDYHLPALEIVYKDSSAGAIMAAGLLLLADTVPDDSGYRSHAHRILGALISTCGVFQDVEAEGLLQHGARHVPNNDVDNMLPYGDYFFLEALLRAGGRKNFYW